MRKMTSYKIVHDGKEHEKPFEYLPKITKELDNLKSNFTINDIRKITLWKIDRYPVVTDDALSQINALRICQELNEEKTREVLTTLLNCEGVGLPMASTYLRFINPDIYQIIDRHAYRAAYYDNPPRVSYSNKVPEKQIDIYIQYLEKLHIWAEEGYYGYFVAFRDMDRFLFDVDKASPYKLNDVIRIKPSKEEIVTWIENVINSNKYN